VLVIATWGRWDYLLVSLVYGLSVIALFATSALYHLFKKSDNQVNVWRKLDHIAIFLMIAGSYTPISYAYLSGAWRVSMIAIPWACVFLGIWLKVFYLRAPRILSTGLYLAMGWLAVIPLWLLWESMPRAGVALLLAGGIAFSAGAIIYALKKPHPWPDRFGFHDIFHLMILLGAGLQFGAIFLAVR
jgi:hemolysin III